MTEIVFIVGLPASGKTTLARSLGMRVFEDAKEMPKGVSGDFVLETPEFCVETRLLAAQATAKELYPEHSHRIIYFQNDVKQCLHNAALRDKKPVDGLIRYLTQQYSPPSGALPVYCAE